MKIDRWFHNHVPVAADTTKNEAPWTLMINKSRTLFQSPPSSITTINIYEASTVLDTHEQDLQGETIPTAHSGYRKNRQVLVVTDSLLKDTEGPICHPDRESQKGRAIFERSRRTREVPEDQGKANVTLVFKKGKKEDPENYRPVSVTSIPGKVTEQIILDAISKHVEEKMVIRSSQHGFTTGKSH
ncbi:rna-directed dna polymerase from mobile element jockey- hypothetical protein [Limosa lapponica baueri]|uniref:Reverse transcriptase domain-containing protein n=1 Tax=Limosa lapponica baueri TaxID=1758121 RepID=A0A2I0UK45_LIMLA|nr:rna-directed dna polymerase from mobile element jockey- hypothetical protein [Limosa lapponica baueri]